MHLGYYWPFDLHPSFLLSRKVVSVNFKGIMKIEQASHHDKITACLNGPIFQPGSNTKGILIPQCCKTHKIVQFWEVTLHIICLKKLKYFWNSFWMETSDYLYPSLCRIHFYPQCIVPLALLYRVSVSPSSWNWCTVVRKKMVRTRIGPSVHLKPLWVRRNHVISFCAWARPLPFHHTRCSRSLLPKPI